MSTCATEESPGNGPTEQALHFSRPGAEGPVLFHTADGNNIPLKSFYAGRACFLVCGGPSLLDSNLGLLNRPGVVTWGINNSAAVLDAQGIRPTFWTCADPPMKFCDRIFRDPTVTKVLPLAAMNAPLRVRVDGKWGYSQWKVRDMPAVWFWQRNSSFEPADFLAESSASWGCEENATDSLGLSGIRSTMLATVKLVYAMGFRTLYILGADFRMEEGKANYAAGQRTDKNTVRHNNKLFEVMNARFAALAPYFEIEGFKVFNCTPGSGLTAFPFKRLAEAVREATFDCSLPIDAEDWYSHQPTMREEYAGYFAGGGD